MAGAESSTPRSVRRGFEDSTPATPAQDPTFERPW
jgi:hypothetical protein